MIFDRFDTIVAPFPFSDIPVMKRRPALVLSSRTFNAANNATVIAMITTAKASHWPSDVTIKDLGEAGLETPCIVRWKLVTIPNELIMRLLGKLSSLDIMKCERELANILR